MTAAASLLRIGLCYVGFVSLGLPDGLLGVAAPSIRASFGVAESGFGSMLLCFMAGYLVASFSSGWVLARMQVGALLALSCLVTAASLLGYALAPVWGTVLAFAVAAGLGAGAIDAGLNTYVATHHGPRTLSWMHACYGIGATSGPAIITANAIGFQVCGAVLGQSLLPSALGLLAGRSGLETIPPALLGAAVVLLALYRILAPPDRPGTSARAADPELLHAAVQRARVEP